MHKFFILTIGLILNQIVLSNHLHFTEPIWNFNGLEIESFNQYNNLQQ